MSIPHIKNAFENVKHACDKNLKKLYPGGIPEMVKERYEEEDIICYQYTGIWRCRACHAGSADCIGTGKI